MDKTEQEKLLKSLQEEEKLILSELNDIARKNPKVEGDFNVPFINEGDSLDENAREITEFERTKAVADNLEERLKGIRVAIEKLKEGSYGVCEKCSVAISGERLKAVQAARLCINCAKISAHEV
ncbi:MAG: DnaK suppressor protein [Parcubacteria group bacterium Gr01-1014_44]|nr:MAG: DnaK suppressor protein [Parcubacteria group bacterium Gr01-1014_44]